MEVTTDRIMMIECEMCVLPHIRRVSFVAVQYVMVVVPHF